jgi:hypothetical protein
MNDEIDDAMDLLLREQFEGAVPDDGFCQSVMDGLPARPRRVTWPLGAGILAGIATCWFTLWSTAIASDGWRDWLSGEPSAATMALFVTMLTMAALALAWAIAETGDRPDHRAMIR